jgi:hypothetical protein
MQPFSYVEKPGLRQALVEAGLGIAEIDGVWKASDAVLAQQIVDAFDPVPALRALKKAAVKAEAAARIETVAALWRQVNMVREMALIAFVPPAQRTQAQIDRFQALRSATDKIDAIRDASNMIEAQIDAEADWQKLAALEVGRSAEWPA